MKANYDKTVDVLYLTLEGHTLDRYQEEGKALVWRIDHGGTYIGCTVTDFKEYWRHKKPALARRISDRFHITRKAAMRLLNV